MKKQIVVQKPASPTEPRPKSSASREERLQEQLRDNLKKRKAQARAKSEANKSES